MKEKPTTMTVYEKFTAVIELAHDRNQISKIQRDLILQNVKPSYELIEFVLDFLSGLISQDSDCFVHALLGSH